MTSLISSKYCKFMGGLAASVIVAAAVHAGDTPASSDTTKGSGASKLSGNTEQSSPGSKSHGIGAPRDAKSFLREAIEGNSAEVALAEVAERKAQNQQVKQFAQMMRQDHSQANQQLRSLAQKHGLSVNQSLDSKHQKKLDKLQNMSGAEFDREYATEMLKDHQKEIAKYEAASRNIQDTEVQQYIQTTLPKLRQHLQHAQQTAQAAGVDQATISGIMKKSDAMGGTADESDEAVGGHQISPQNQD